MFSFKYYKQHTMQNYQYKRLAASIMKHNPALPYYFIHNNYVLDLIAIAIREKEYFTIIGLAGIETLEGLQNYYESIQEFEECAAIRDIIERVKLISQTYNLTVKADLDIAK